MDPLTKDNISTHETAPSSVWLWTALVIGGVFLGGALALAWRRPFAAALWVALGGAVIGVGGLVLGIRGLLRAVAPPAPTNTPRAADVKATASGDAHLRDRETEQPVRTLNGARLSVFVLQELDRSLSMLRQTSAPADLETLTDLLQEMESWAGRLAVEKARLQLNARETRQVFGLRTRLVELEKALARRSGGDPAAVDRKLQRTTLEITAQEREALCEECAGRVSHVARQFQEHPALRESLTAVARSVRVFLGRPVRTKSSGEVAFAATVRMPDLPTLEKMIQELKDLEEQSDSRSTQHAADDLAVHKLRLKKLVASTGATDEVGQWPHLKVMSSGLRAAVSSLDSGEVKAARQHLNEVLDAVRQSAVGGEAES